MWERLFDGSLMPHGHCLLWRPDLLLLHVGGDVMTAISYALIPLGLIYLVKKRTDLRFDRLFWLFAAFIFFCGLTHLIGLINIWHGYYFIEGVAKFSTGIVSAITALMLLRLLPVILAIPSKEALQQQNKDLLALKVQLLKANSELEERVRQRTKKLEAIARTDDLTGVLNRGEIFRIAHDEFARAQRYERKLSIIMIDIDYFKAINDNYGHQAGDEALVAVASALRRCCRANDHLGRYGGEEFMIICPEIAATEAASLAERCKSAIENLTFRFSLTISLGVAEYNSEETIDRLINNADRALYQAKDAGRNRISIAPADE